MGYIVQMVSGACADL